MRKCKDVIAQPMLRVSAAYAMHVLRFRAANARRAAWAVEGAQGAPRGRRDAQLVASWGADDGARWGPVPAGRDLRADAVWFEGAAFGLSLALGAVSVSGVTLPRVERAAYAAMLLQEARAARRGRR